MSYDLDPNLEQFATSEQWKKLKALAEHGSDRLAAAALGVHPRTMYNAREAVKAKALRAGYSPEHYYTRPVPEGYRLRGVSTLHDRNGNVVMQWVKSAVDHLEADKLLEAIKAAYADELPAEQPSVPPPEQSPLLLSVYPVGDHHFGMLSWHAETGADYDLSIGEDLLVGAVTKLADAAPQGSDAVLVLLGDFLHYDNFETVTPKNRNQLDSDSRFPRVVEAAFRSLRRIIQKLLTRHANLHIIVEIGNHDPASSIWLMVALAQIYEANPWVSVDVSPSHFHYYRFGKVLLGTHHGDTVKMDKLPGIMAADKPEEWGATEFRYWLTGHIHKDSQSDFPGCSVESFRILPPADAWAHQMGYRPLRDMKLIIFHAHYGEVERISVNPKMLLED